MEAFGCQKPFRGQMLGDKEGKASSQGKKCHIYYELNPLKMKSITASSTKDLSRVR